MTATTPRGWARFRDPETAGRHLAAYLLPLAGRDDVIVLGMAGNGVAVAEGVARALDADVTVADVDGVLAGGTFPPVGDRVAVIVDEGIGVAWRAAGVVALARLGGARRVVVAAPVCSAGACATLRRQADEVVCAEAPEPYVDVAAWYEARPAGSPLRTRPRPRSAGSWSPGRPAGGERRVGSQRVGGSGANGHIAG